VSLCCCVESQQAIQWQTEAQGPPDGCIGSCSILLSQQPLCVGRANCLGPGDTCQDPDLPSSCVCALCTCTHMYRCVPQQKWLLPNVVCLLPAAAPILSPLDCFASVFHFIVGSSCAPGSRFLKLGTSRVTTESPGHSDPQSLPLP
jgi:hypothetical protein